MAQISSGSTTSKSRTQITTRVLSDFLLRARNIYVSEHFLWPFGEKEIPSESLMAFRRTCTPVHGSSDSPSCGKVPPPRHAEKSRFLLLISSYEPNCSLMSQATEEKKYRNDYAEAQIKERSIVSRSPGPVSNYVHLKASGSISGCYRP